METYADLTYGTFYLLASIGILGAGVLAFRRFNIALPDAENWHTECFRDLSVRRVVDDEGVKFLYQAGVLVRNDSKSRQTIVRIRGSLKPNLERLTLSEDPTPEELDESLGRGVDYGMAMAPGASHTHHVSGFADELIECGSVYYAFDYRVTRWRRLKRVTKLKSEWGVRAVMLRDEDLERYSPREQLTKDAKLD